MIFSEHVIKRPGLDANGIPMKIYSKYVDANRVHPEAHRAHPEGTPRAVRDSMEIPSISGGSIMIERL